MIRIKKTEGIRKLVRWHAGNVVFVTKEARNIGLKDNDKIYVQTGEDVKTKEKCLVIKKVKD